MDLRQISEPDFEKLKCKCGQYINKPPIYTKNKENICVNCVDFEDDSPNKAFRNDDWEKAANYFKFPCQNKVRGCNDYVKFDEVENHEVACPYRTFSCMFNLHSSCEWEGCAKELYKHYEILHPEFCSKAAEVKILINKDYEACHAIKTLWFPFLLHVKCETAKNKLQIGLYCFLKAEEANLVKYNLNLHNATRLSLTFEDAHPLPFMVPKTEDSELIRVDISSIKDILKTSESLKCSWRITEEEELKALKRDEWEDEHLRLYEQKKEQIKCLDCGYFAVPPIYRCYNDHVICINCQRYHQFCKPCKRSRVEFSEATDLEEIAKRGRFYCKWCTSTRPFSYEEIRHHERVCYYRTYTCPHCKLYSGLYNYVLKHVKKLHYKYYFNPDNYFCIDEQKMFYFFAFREIFSFDLRQKNFRYYGSPRFIDFWNFQVLTNNGESVNFAKTCCNGYVPDDKSQFVFENKQYYRINVQPKLGLTIF